MKHIRDMPSGIYLTFFPGQLRLQNMYKLHTPINVIARVFCLCCEQVDARSD